MPESQVERLLRSIVEKNGLRLEHHDDGSQNGMFDYWVCGADLEPKERLGVLEVGSVTNPVFRQSYQAHIDKYRGFDDVSLTWKWHVMCEFGVRFRTIQGQLVPLLLELERHGIERLHRWAPPNALITHPLPIGVSQITRRHDHIRQWQVAYNFSWSTNSSPSALSTLVRVEEWLNGDSKDAAGIRRKVNAHPHLPYHGVVIHMDGAPEPKINGSYQRFNTPLEYDIMPDRPPELPEGFTELWLIGPQGRGWRWNSKSSWTFVDG